MFYFQNSRDHPFYIKSKFLLLNKDIFFDFKMKNTFLF